MGNSNSGRRPAPTVMKLLRGIGKHRLNPAEAAPPVGEVVAPASLSPGALLVWGEMAPICLQMGTLTPADVLAFASWCELQALFAQVTHPEPGTPINARDLMAVAQALRPYYDYFGMTPSSRSRIQVPRAPEAPKSKWDGALA